MYDRHSYSGSDIAIVVRDALMQPIRKVLTATHFKYLQDTKKWTPCSPGDPEAQEKSWTDIESDELQEPPLRLADFLKSLDSVRPTVTADDIKKHFKGDVGGIGTPGGEFKAVVVFVSLSHTIDRCRLLGHAVLRQYKRSQRTM